MWKFRSQNYCVYKDLVISEIRIRYILFGTQLPQPLYHRCCQSLFYPFHRQTLEITYNIVQCRSIVSCKHIMHENSALTVAFSSFLHDIMLGPFRYASYCSFIRSFWAIGKQRSNICTIIPEFKFYGCQQIE